MDLSRPSPRYASFTCAVNSKFYLWGGRKEKGVNSPVSLLYHFDYCNEKWNSEYLKGLLPPSSMFGSCAQSDHFLYGYGGEKDSEKDNDGSYTGSLFKIDTNRHCFMEVLDSNHSSNYTTRPMRKNDSGMVVHGDKVIVFGGKPDIRGLQGSDDERTNELHVYDSLTGIWSEPMVTGDIPPPCSNFSYTKISEETLVMFGGYWGSDVFSNELYIFNFRKLHWTRIPSEGTWPAPRRAHTASVLGYGSSNIEIVVIGGVNADTTLDEVWQLNTNSWKWKKLSLSNHKTLKRRWHMSGSRQISPEVCEVILFGGIRERQIIAETALLIFAYDYWERTWILKEVVDTKMLGTQERLQKKHSLCQFTKHKAILKEEIKMDKKTCTMCRYIKISAVISFLMGLISLIIYVLIHAFS